MTESIEGAMTSGIIPIPAVVVVGNFSESDPFTGAAWRQICGEYEREGSGFGDPVLGSSEIELRSWLQPGSRAESSRLLPVGLSDGGSALSESFNASLQRVLMNYDVWAIVACTTSQNTPHLLRAMDVSDVPVLLSVDSSADQHSRGSNVLNLMSSNMQQAQAICSLITGSRVSMDEAIEVYCHPGTDRYVADLRGAIEQYFGYRQLRPVVRNLPDIGGRGVVICVGYREAFLNLMTLPRISRTVILSDGCYDDDVVLDKLSVRAATREDEDFYWARPVFEPGSCALDGYLAVSLVWTEHCRSDHEDHAGLWPARRMVPLIRLIECELERFARPYLFHSGRNVAGAFVVEGVPIKSGVERESSP